MLSQFGIVPKIKTKCASTLVLFFCHMAERDADVAAVTEITASAAASGLNVCYPV